MSSSCASAGSARRRAATRGAKSSLALLGAAASAALALPAQAAALPPAPISAARLQGSFLLAGAITAERGVRGERRGQQFMRRWVFTSSCASGPCPTVTLVRGRAAGSDTLVLGQRSPGVYRGKGSFTRPLRCAGRIYPVGERIPFTITVTINAAVLSSAGALATRVSATYVNTSRVNLTPCVAFLGHDSARYHGHVVPYPTS